MADLFRHAGGDLEAMLRAFPRPEEGQTGVAALLSGRPVVVDAFDRPETLASLWDRLVSGYAADALGRAPAPAPPGAVEELLGAAAAGEATSHEGVGLGTEVAFTSGPAVGAALVWEGVPVHLAVFARAGEGRRSRTAEGRIARPSRRRHFYGG